MASILLVQRRPWQNLGIMSLSAALKGAGHSVSLFAGGDPAAILRRARQLQPSAVGFSVMTGDHPWAVSAARLVKRELPRTLTVLGGPHPTYFPEIVEVEGVDAIVRGEGETPAVALLDRLDRGESIADLPNLWAKTGGAVARNGMGVYEDVSALPLPDRSLYAENGIPVDWSTLNVLTSRGCPYACTFCYEKQLRELYRGKGKHVRVRSEKSVVAEILAARRMGLPFSTVLFVDDYFGTDTGWLRSFLDLYQAELRLPFICLVRPEVLVREPDLADRLKEAGCHSVAFGVETGSEELRNRVLKKAMTDETILRSTETLHRAGVPFKTYNLFGFPGETAADACATVDLNIRIRADFPLSNIFIPFPKTELTEYAITHGCLSASDLEGIGSGILTRRTIAGGDPVFTERIHRLFQTAVLLPRLWPALRRFCASPVRSRLLDRLLDLWFAAVYFFVYWRSSSRSLPRLLSYALRNFKDVLR